MQLKVLHSMGVTASLTSLRQSGDNEQSLDLAFDLILLKAAFISFNENSLVISPPLKNYPHLVTAKQAVAGRWG